MAETIERDKSGALRARARLFQILGVPERHKVLGAFFGKRHRPTPVQ